MALYRNMEIIRFLVKNKNVLFLFAICCLFLFLKILYFSNGDAYFDEGVYISIAKYITSGVEKGYFESIRPLMFPVLLSPLQLFSFNQFIAGRVLSLVLVICCILLVYYITKTHFGKDAGIWAALLFAVSPSIIRFGGYILPDIVAY